MQYTDSVNRIIWRYGFFFLATIYILFLLFQYLNWDDGNRLIVANQKTIYANNLINIEGVILGGSNSAFSLSAEIISKNYNESWINLSLMNEGYNDKNYFSYIKNTIDKTQRSKVKKVFYSSIVPMRDNFISKRVSSSDPINGSQKFNLISESSIAGLLKSIIQKQSLETVMYTMPNEFGDYIFSGFECPKNFNAFPKKRNNNIEQINDWISMQLSSLLYLFPNAQIVFILPSEYHQPKFDKSLDKILFKAIEESIDDFNDLNSQSILFIKQASFPSLKFMCDSDNHANYEGRVWRTKDLLSKIQFF